MLSKDVEKADISINTISEKAKEKAKSFPAVNGDLPAWKGICVVEKAEFAWPWASTETYPERVKDTSDTVYKKTEVQEISEAGYNFVRVYLDIRYFFTEILKGYNEYAKENNVRWMLQEYGCVNQIGAGQQNEYVKAVVDILKEYGVPYSYHSFNGTYFSICDYEKGDGNVFITPGAEYEATSGGHKINIALRDITSK